MHKQLKEHIEYALREYTQNDYYNCLLEAKNEYTELVGKIQEEDRDFEGIMNSFNDWYLFGFLSKNKTRTIIKEYMITNPIDEFVVEAFRTVRFTLLEFNEKGMGGSFSLFDYLKNTSIKLAKTHEDLALVKGDIFLGRVISYKDEQYLLDGISLLPKDIRPLIKRHIRELRILKNHHKEKEYLFKLEKLKNKWKNYRHIDPNIYFENNLK